VKQSEPRGALGGPADAAPGRTGIFFCRCGPNLGQVVQLGQLERAEAWPEAAEVATHDVLCSPEGQAWLRERIRERGLERVLVAACSPREHESTFRAVLAAAGRSPWLLQMVNLREQVDWIGGDPAAATARAGRLVGAALARLALHRPLPAEEVEVAADVLVVGAGAAGLSAARALAGKGRKVVVAERSFVVGGLANQLDEVFPDLECASCFMEPVLDRVLHDERIEVLTGAEVRAVRGAAGRFEIELELAPRGVDPAACLGCGECAKLCPVERPDPYGAGLARVPAIGLAYPGCLPHASSIDRATCLRSHGKPCEACLAACAFGAIHLDEAPRRKVVTVGAVVLATGLRPGETGGPAGVVTSYGLERMLHPDGPTRGEVRGAGGREPRAVLLVPDADEEGDLAAQEILKLAHLVKAKLPGATVKVAGDLHRVAQLRRRARALEAEGVSFVDGVLAGLVTATGDSAHSPAGSARAEGAGPLRVRLSSGSTVDADLVVINPPARPADGATELARLLRIPTTERGFFLDRAPSPFEPTATRVSGIFVAGAAAGPRTIAQAIRDGAAAAGLVLASLVPGERRPVEPLASEVDLLLCGGCGICVSACPVHAVELRDGKAHVEPVHCRGCGTCAAACPTGAASARHFTRAQIAAEITGLLSGGTLASPSEARDPPAPPLAAGQPHPAAPALASRR
jgi:heterodisulfide reductase subunit A